jgi:hypothetical protein
MYKYYQILYAVAVVNILKRLGFGVNQESFANSYVAKAFSRVTQTFSHDKYIWSIFLWNTRLVTGIDRARPFNPSHRTLGRLRIAFKTCQGQGTQRKKRRGKEWCLDSRL